MKVKKSFAQILEGIDGSQQMKLERKLPDWAALGAEVPTPLALEQCSSSPAAAFKAALARELAGGCLRGVCDITGGLGSDCAAFARLSEKVWYFERDERLVEAARRNFALLGLGNIETLCAEVGPGTPLPDCDLIYADPARRTSGGRKVFRMEDCAPDIGALASALLRRSPLLMVKLSPMADIDIVVRSLGPHCRRIDVVSSSNECKEVVAYLDREYDGECTICAKCSGKGEFLFTRAEENAAEAILPGQGLNRIMSESGTFLLEPDRALLKAGAFRLPCRRFAIAMLDRSTHFYITSSLCIPTISQAPCSAGSDCISGSPIAGNVSAAGNPELQDFFRIFRIIKVLPLDKNGIRTAGKDFPQADVTARNVPMGSDELRRRLKVQPSGRYHIFGLKVTAAQAGECFPAASGNYLFITERL